MRFAGRVAELGRLRAALDRLSPSLVRVSGVRGGGKTALLARALADYGSLVHTAPPLPDEHQRRMLAATLSRAGRGVGGPSGGGSPPAPWPELLDDILALAPPDGRPFVLVLDDLHRLVEARSPWLAAAIRLLDRARDQGRPLHVALVGPTASMPADADLGAYAGEWLRVGPLPFRVACTLLPGARPADYIRAYAVFGGIPRVLVSLDRAVTVGTNIRRLVLQPNESLADFGGSWLERDVQTPARYFALLSGLASGEADWATLHAGLPDLTRSGQLAPYVRKLEELGLVAVRRSLDAPPTARAARYAVADPFVAFWTRYALTASSTRTADGRADAYADLVRPTLDEHVAGIFPLICRQHVAHDGIETIGANARESGSLWGSGYDIPVAGILTSGAAYYGSCHWRQVLESGAPLDALDRQIRETRFGFGRERRIRLVFLGQEAPPWLQREVARRLDAQVVDAAGLVGA